MFIKGKFGSNLNADVLLGDVTRNLHVQEELMMITEKKRKRERGR